MFREISQIMTPIEIIATILAVFILVKILIIFISLESWLKIAEALLKKRLLSTIIYSAFVVLVGFYVFSELNIVQIAAVMLFTSLIIALAIALIKTEPGHAHIN